MASISYQVRIFDRSNAFLTSVNDPYNFSWSRALSKPGSATFGIDTNDSRATATILRPFNRVEIWRRSWVDTVYRGTLVWRGYIEVVQGKSDRMNIVCQETLNLLNYRLTAATKTFSGVDAGVAAFELLTDTNAVQDTLIDTGTEDVSATVSLEFKRENVLAAIGKVAEAAGGAEFEIVASYAGTVLSEILNFKQQLGTDKSATVAFKYITGRPEEINVLDYEVFTDGKDMKNKAYVSSSAGGTAEQNYADATSQTTYGLLESQQTMNDKTTNAALLASATDIVTQWKDPAQIPKVTPDATKIDIESFTVGDTVRLILSRGYISIDQNHRITAISVKLGNNGDEQVDVQLAEVGKRTVRENVLATLDTLRQRISQLERGN